MMSLIARDGARSAPEIETALAEHVVSTRFEQIPADIIDTARRNLLWTFATAMAGSNAEGSAAVVDFLREQGGSGAATLVGTGLRGSASAAAFANAVFSKAHEYEDKYWQDNDGGFAMGFAIASAVFAAAEAQGGVDGRSLLTAMALGIDVQARMLTTITSDLAPTHTGWNSTYLFCNYGATVGVARVLGLSRAQVLDALGLIHAQAAGNFQGQMEGVLGIRMQGGFAVRNAIAAVGLARRGVSGAQEFISGRFGFYKLHFPNHSTRLETLTDGLGTDFLGRKIGFKGYPCGVVAHPLLDAVLQLRDRIAPERIAAIRVYGTTILGVMANPREHRLNPRNGIDAQFSLPWVLACALRDGGLHLQHFDDALVRDARYLDLAHKVEIDMQTGREAAWIEIVLTDGAVLRSEPVLHCKGHPLNPVTTDEMVSVFHRHMDLAAVPPPPERRQAIVSALLSIADQADIRSVFAD